MWLVVVEPEPAEWLNGPTSAISGMVRSRSPCPRRSHAVSVPSQAVTRIDDGCLKSQIGHSIGFQITNQHTINRHEVEYSTRCVLGGVGLRVREKRSKMMSKLPHSTMGLDSFITLVPKAQKIGHNIGFQAPISSQ